ncbi:MAG: P1 family peptidase [Isosphaeraceae bacterium]
MVPAIILIPGPILGNLATLLISGTVMSQDPEPRARARAIGLSPGVFPTGTHNAITDVPGVKVGHVTLKEGDSIRTGVTAIVPHGGNLFQSKVPGAVFVGNAFGKLAGSTQVEELGTIEAPIVLTNTLSVGTAIEAVVDYTLGLDGNDRVRSVNAVVGETNDGGLNDIRGRPVTREHVLRAIRESKAGPVAEGCVGAGTGCEAFGWKGGIGTSSRIVRLGEARYTLGVLVQANFGGVLTMGGAPVGLELGRHPFRAMGQVGPLHEPREARPADGSCLIVVATDAPLDARDLRRLAARSVFGLARTGSSFSNGSGDYSIAFSTAEPLRVKHGEAAVATRPLLTTEALDGLFQAVLEATEESVYNALLMAETTAGRGNRTVGALPIDRVRAILEAHGLGKKPGP